MTTSSYSNIDVTEGERLYIQLLLSLAQSPRS